MDALDDAHADDMLGRLTEYGRSLYEHEYGITTNIERDLAFHLSGMSSVRWWHKINERRKGEEFSIRGFINHYPDFMVMTSKGMLILVETKGTQLVGNADTSQKIELGTAWAGDAGKKCRYFMVAEEGMETPRGCLRMRDLLDVLEAE